MSKEYKSKKKGYLLLLLLLLLILLIGGWLLLRSDDDSDGSSTTADTTVSDSTPATSSGLYAAEDLFFDGSFDINPFALTDADLPSGYSLHETEGDIVVLEGCLSGSNYCRFEQRLTYPEDTPFHNALRDEANLYHMTMQAVVTSDQSILDTYLTDQSNGEGMNSSHELNVGSDIHMVLWPSAYVRTENAVFFLISDRMSDGNNCNGADDCDESFTIGRFFNSDENSILSAYENIFKALTGDVVDSWQWTYKG